jgi:hypothetical protein
VLNVVLVKRSTFRCKKKPVSNSVSENFEDPGEPRNSGLISWIFLFDFLLSNGGRRQFLGRKYGERVEQWDERDMLRD